MKNFKINRRLVSKCILLVLAQIGCSGPNLNANNIENDQSIYYNQDPSSGWSETYINSNPRQNQQNDFEYYEPEKYRLFDHTPHPGPTAAKMQSSQSGTAASFPFGTHTYSANGELAEAEPVDELKGLNTRSVLEETHPAVAPAPERETQVQTEPVQPTSSGTQLSPAPQNTPPPPPSQAPVQNEPNKPDDKSEANSQAIPNPATPASVGPINFNNVSMIEYIRFISRVSNKNFVFEDEDLQFNVTIISEEPTPVENLMTALLQELKIRDLSLMEQGNTIIIHRNPRVRSPGHIVFDVEGHRASNAEIITRVFRLNTLDPTKATEIVKPLLSDDALVEVLRDTNNLIITDLVENVDKIARLISSLDAPNSGVVVGQYVVHNGFVDTLVDLASRILFPIAQGNPFVLVPHAPSNSIYIVSNSYIVEKALAVLQNLDNNEGKTKIFSLDQLHPTGYNPETGAFGPGEPAGPPSQAPILPALPPEFPSGSIGRGPSVYNETSEFLPGGISAASRYARELPAGHIERTVFFIYKLKYRRGDQIDVSLRKIALSLMTTGIANIDLVSAINSVQWIESSNSLIFTGTVPALEKIKDLILEVDTPLHQVYIEMLILDTTLEDSLHYGVDWGLLFGGGNTAGR